MDISVDLTEVRTLAADLSGTEPELAYKARPVVAEVGDKVWRVMREDMQSSGSFGQIARAITSEVTDGGYGVEIGPEKGRPGSLANIAYFAPSVSVYRGGPKWQLEVGRGAGRGGGTVRDPREALMEHADEFASKLADALVEVLL